MADRLFILFLDGADFSLVREAMKKGLLPGFSQMASKGVFRPLATSFPAESPVAFAEVLTGCNPGKHGIFDFLHRDPATKMPRISLFKTKDGGYENGLATETLSPSLRRGGVRHALIRIPCTFPPQEDADLVLCGLGLPDVAGTWGRARAFTASKPNADDLFGTVEARYERPADGIFRLSLPGPAGKIARLDIEKEGEKYRLGNVEWPAGKFSPWMTVDFEGGGKGVAAVHAGGAPDKPVFTVTPVWTHPSEPRLPAAKPADLPSRLADRYGLFPVSGWPEPNLLFAEGRTDFSAFLEMCNRAATDLEAHAFDVLSDPSFDMVMLNYELFDRLAHAGFGETASREVQKALFGALIRFDSFISKVRNAFPKSRIWVASDHGFAPWKRRVNVNRWLVEAGYLASDAKAPDPNLSALSEDRLLWEGVDWSRTRAYSVGLSKIYLNLEGREAGGVVPQGRPAELVRKEIIERLSALRDPQNGRPVFRRVLDARRL